MESPRMSARSFDLKKKENIYVIHLYANTFQKKDASYLKVREKRIIKKHGGRYIM